ncbi:MAG: SDR family oxidoreductase [Phycisphaerales bacterium]|nr:SDR family oxidoreductase [Phycisphaerales bacterium]
MASRQPRWIRRRFSSGQAESPLHRNITQEEVGKAAAFLLSDHAGAITAENIFVDAGYHAVGL